MKVRAQIKPASPTAPKRVVTLSLIGPLTVVSGPATSILQDAGSGTEYHFEAVSGMYLGWGVGGQLVADWEVDRTPSEENL